MSQKDSPAEIVYDERKTWILEIKTHLSDPLFVDALRVFLNRLGSQDRSVEFTKIRKSEDVVSF